jgi:dienelactone hydrolase
MTRNIIALIVLLSFGLNSFSQKKSLDHSVYDGWQSIGERKINASGDWIAYVVDVQEGDGSLIVQKTDSSFQESFPRGYSLNFSYDGRYLVFKIKPPYADIRSARIKKKKPEDMPKDSLAIYDLETRSVEKVANVSSFKMPEKAAGFLAVHLLRKPADTIRKSQPKDTLVVPKDTVKKNIPLIIEQVPDKKQKRKLSSKTEQDDEDAEYDADGDEITNGPVQEGTELLVYSLGSPKKISFPLVNEFYWSDNAKILLLETSASKTDKSIKPAVSIWRSAEDRLDTLLKGGNDFKNFTIDDNGYQIAFLAERDSAFKSLQKFYKLWYWRNGDKEATVLADKFTKGMKANWTVSEYSTPNFSHSGNKLFFGTAPIKPIRDTSLIEMDLVKLDIWHYNDDYLQSYQLKTADQENRRSYLSSIDLASRVFVQLGDPDVPAIMTSYDGDGNLIVGVTDKGKRIPMQWEGGTKKSIYIIDPLTGDRKKIISDLNGMPQISPHGNYVIWYDMIQKNYFTYCNDIITNISKSIPFRLYDEEYDMPSEPTPYGIMRWHEKDSFVYVYDRYDIWRLDPAGKKAPLNITSGMGRRNTVSYRYINLDPDEKFLSSVQTIVLKTFNEKNKNAGISSLKICCGSSPVQLQSGPFALGLMIKARSKEHYIYTKESFSTSPDMHFSADLRTDKKLSSINQQQTTYNWMTAELYTWKAYDGKTATGIVYKPEDFVPGKKYPMIAYFYETLSDGLFNYLAPSPTPSRLNIPFFVSRGYIVLAPDIHYKDGYPGKAAFDYVVSGARSLVKKGWVDSTRMGIQGQSWGGYQVAHIITRTPLFAAAWAGAPVANMTSAYGGIRWESGMNRQFQYEKSQSRIGATLWQKPQLYIENSPLFHLPKVKTPLVIMSNDNDGAVPWYQGIEMFTAMRRLNKKVWLLNYNGEAHNLIERKNRKDIQIREQQFFDWLLKGEKPSVWLTEGVPAVDKGRNWGLETSLN